MTSLSFRLALSTAGAAIVLGAAPALADYLLPAPYVSRSLDAVLLPIDADVRSVFDLDSDDTGLLVLATEPWGVADEHGIVPGDVIHLIGGRKVVRPIELDEIVHYWILEGVFDFDLGVYRDGGYVEVISTITEESYWEEIEITSIETWSSWEVEASFSYEEYYAEYSEEIVESYETSETLIEETVTSEEFTAEIPEETYEQEYPDEASEDEVMSEESGEDVAEDEVFDDDLEEEAAQGAEEDYADEEETDEASPEEDSVEADCADPDYAAEYCAGEVTAEGEDQDAEEAYEEEVYDEPEDESFDEGYDDGDEG